MDRQPENQAYEVPLHELLAAVPLDARLIIEEKSGLGTSFIPIGSLANKTAAELRRLHQVNRDLFNALEWIAYMDATKEDYKHKAYLLVAKHKEQA